MEILCRVRQPCSSVAAWWRGKANKHKQLFGIVPGTDGGQILGGRFGFFFSARGMGRGSEAPERGWGGVGFILKIPEAGGSPREGEGAEGSGGCLRFFFWGGGGLNIFFGAESPTKTLFMCFLVLAEERKHINKISRKSQDSPGTLSCTV